MQTEFTLNELSNLISAIYIWAIIISVLAFGLIFLISNLIAFQGGKNPKDPAKRKMWFFIIWFVTSAGFFVYNFWFNYMEIPNIAFQSDYFIHVIISSLLVVVLYFLLVFIVSKICKSCKIATIFPSKNG